MRPLQMKRSRLLAIGGLLFIGTTVVLLTQIHKNDSDAETAPPHPRVPTGVAGDAPAGLYALQKENKVMRESQEAMQNKLYAAEGKLKSLEEINGAQEEEMKRALKEKLELKEELQRLKHETSERERHDGVVTGDLPDGAATPSDDANQVMKALGTGILAPGRHKLAILVPFRNVEKELQSFVPHMHKFLSKKGIDFNIVIINQTDNWRFNRGQLLNVGELLTRGSHDYIAMHDVDLLPMNDNLPYSYPDDRVAMHLASPKLHPIYHYPNFIGGVMLLQNRDYETINGLSNQFWGWGREDDELFWRLTTQHSCPAYFPKPQCSEFKMKIVRPEEVVTINTGYKTFNHLHDEKERPRDYSKVGGQWKAGLERDKETGVDTSKHKVVRIAVQDVKGYPYLRVDVELACNAEKTPWCKWYEKCLRGFYRAKPEHKVCSVCTKKCWTGFALVGECSQTTTPACKKIGRDVSELEVMTYGWPRGTVRH